nr:desiccation-related protein PCC13-62-like [Tanacetum cinerariifolium]
MITTVFLFFLIPLVAPEDEIDPDSKTKIPKSDKDIFEFALNLEYLEAEFFLYGSLGKGLDHIQPNLTGGGPRTIGARIAKLTPFVRNIITQFGFQEVGHIRAIKSVVPGFARPLLNLSTQTFATAMNKAFGRPLFPPFNPYANDLNYLLASYIIPYIGLTGYVGANQKLQSASSKLLLAGLLGVESGQDAVIRTLLYQQATEKVIPYEITVAEFTNKISILRNNLGHSGIKDEGIIVPAFLGVEKKIPGNILTGNEYSLAYGQKPEEILRIVYGSGKVEVAGGFYPNGANGTIARKFLKSKKL